MPEQQTLCGFPVKFVECESRDRLEYIILGSLEEEIRNWVLSQYGIPPEVANGRKDDH